MREGERPRRAVDGLLPLLGDGVGERAPLEVGVVEEERDDGDEPDAGVALELLIEVEIVLVDLVRVVRLQPGEAVVLQARGDLEALFERHVGFVAAVEAAVRRREEPDAGRELEVELERFEVADERVGIAVRGLRAEVGERHGAGG